MKSQVNIELYKITQDSALKPKFEKSVSTILEITGSTCADIMSAVYAKIESRGWVKDMEKKKEELEVNGLPKTGSDAIPSTVIKVNYTAYVAPVSK